jgi:hypothetical protein
MRSVLGEEERSTWKRCSGGSSVATRQRVSLQNESNVTRQELLVALDAHRLLGYCYIVGVGNAGGGSVSMEVIVRIRRRLI